MKKNKSNIICAVICIIVTLAPLALAAFGVVKNNIEKKDEEALNEQQQEQQQTDNHDHETSDSTDTDETTENTEPEDTIPSIKDDPELPDVQGKPSIDVSEMTKNPEAEVVDSKIEYGTKEADSNEK